MYCVSRVRACCFYFVDISYRVNEPGNMFWHTIYLRKISNILGRSIYDDVPAAINMLNICSVEVPCKNGHQAQMGSCSFWFSCSLVKACIWVKFGMCWPATCGYWKAMICVLCRKSSFKSLHLRILTFNHRNMLFKEYRVSSVL